MAVNLTATFAAIRAAVPHLRGPAGASIINGVGGVGVRPTRGERPISQRRRA